jgi:hypothetical protein
VTIRAGDNLKALLARVTRATAARGKKTALASFLGIPRQRISNWLSFDHAPNGEVTLQLLEWVQAEEAQQKKNRGTARTAPRHKTRSTHSSYEKRKTSPNKR